MAAWARFHSTEVEKDELAGMGNLNINAVGGMVGSDFGNKRRNRTFVVEKGLVFGVVKPELQRVMYLM